MFERLEYFRAQPPHAHLVEARIALAWSTGWKADVDGIIKLGMCKKASDLERELHVYDIVILIYRPYWLDLFTSGSDRDWLLDHELTHAELSRDKYGNAVRDERGRMVYRIRKHDYEEFYEVQARHPQAARVREFAKRLRAIAEAAYTPCGKVDEHGACQGGWFVFTENGLELRRRCECYEAFYRTREEAREALAS